MRPSAPLRLVALLLALAAALVTPGLAVAHGRAHDHLAHEHAGAGDHPAVAARDELADHHDDGDAHDAEIALSGPAHQHEHGHAAVDVAPGARELPRVDLAPVTAEPPAALVASELSLAHAPAIADPALLARPDPATGPPPKLRAPPVG